MPIFYLKRDGNTENNFLMKYVNVIFFSDSMIGIKSILEGPLHLLLPYNTSNKNHEAEALINTRPPEDWNLS